MHKATLCVITLSCFAWSSQAFTTAHIFKISDKELITLTVAAFL